MPIQNDTEYDGGPAWSSGIAPGGVVAPRMGRPKNTADQVDVQGQRRDIRIEEDIDRDMDPGMDIDGIEEKKNGTKSVSIGIDGFQTSRAKIDDFDAEKRATRGSKNEDLNLQEDRMEEKWGTELKNFVDRKLQN